MGRKMSASRWLLLSIGLIVLASLLSYPGALGLSMSKPLTAIETRGGFLHSAKIPEGIPRHRGREILFPERPMVLEDGVPLSRPDSTSEKIANAGRGRYQFNSGRIDFSTSEAAPVGGRVYSVRSPLWSLPEFLLLPLWILAAVASAITLRALCPGYTIALRSGSGVRWISVGLAAGLGAGVLIFPAPVSDAFFIGLGIPAVWALLMATLTVRRDPVSRVAWWALALVPALAGLFYYGLQGASNGSFLVGGVIPSSDARIHFLQAAEIAIQGTTPTMFNGRFLYPAFYAVLLSISGLNVLVANFLVSSMVLVGLGATCPLVARRVGIAGTAVYCFLFWLYFRVYGCGLLMTENLGLLLGLVGFGLLLLSVDRQSIWMVFASIAFLGLALVARPGAMFVLPALALYAGFRVWSAKIGRLRIPRALGAMTIGLVIILGCFSANQMLIKALSWGETETFGNFAFTLHGLMNDTTWSTSAEEFGWNSSLVMEANIRQIKESPMSLVRGVGRAYGETFRRKFLFRFGEGNLFITSGMALFFLATLGSFFWRPLRADAGWIVLSALAIFASIPFAPPWDAAERPYAATEPMQIFLVAGGFAMILAILRQAAERVIPGPATEIDLPNGNRRPGGFLVFAAVCFVLVLPAPLLLRAELFRPKIPSGAPALLPGSHRWISQGTTTTMSELAREQFLDRLSDYQEGHPEDAKAYTAEPGNFVLGIDWRNLETVLVPRTTAPLPAR